MLDSLRRLMEIQDLDTRLAAVDAELTRIPEESRAAADELEQAKQSVERARALLEGEQRQERQLEIDMREQEALRVRLEGQSAQVTSPQAYEALRHELQHAREAGSNCETAALELMEAMDRARSEVDRSQQLRADLEASVPVRLAELSSREQALSRERADLRKLRSKRCESVKPLVLRDYERIAGKRHPAVVVLEGTTCPECHIVVPTQQGIEIRSGRATQHCASCMRLLVSPLVLEDSAPE